MIDRSLASRAVRMHLTGRRADARRDQSGTSQSTRTRPAARQDMAAGQSLPAGAVAPDQPFAALSARRRRQRAISAGLWSIVE
jgi:hypothetical protein